MKIETDALLRAQLDLHGRLARSLENFKKLGAAKMTQGAVETRIQLVEFYWRKFEQNDETLRSKFWNSVENSEYITKDFGATVEGAYLDARGALADLLYAARVPGDGARPAAVESASSRTALPRISLPVFSGRFEDWPSFRDLFRSIIGRDQSLGAVKRLHYLKTSVRGEAEQLIRCFSIIEENYDRAWAILVEHYENRRLLVSSYYNAFLALPRMRSESAGDLCRIYHGMTAAVGSLEGIGRPVGSSPDLFVHLVVNLLDSRTRRNWELSIGGTTDPPSYEELRRFLETRLHMLVAMTPGRAEGGVVAAKQSDGASRPVRAHHVQKASKKNRCAMCTEGHFIMSCDTYQRKQPAERKRAVESGGLCGNCLGRHPIAECKSPKNCSICNKRHHTSLHEACLDGAVEAVGDQVTSHLVKQSRPRPSRVLLATARVMVRDALGALQHARALVDPASETSLVAESLVQRLRVTRSRTSVVVVGVGDGRPDPTRGEVEIDVVARYGDARLRVGALVLPRITSYGRRADMPLTAWSHLQGLALADPDLGAGDPVELLLGAEVFAGILKSGTRAGGPRVPVAQETTLGWIITGLAGQGEEGPPARAVHVCSVDMDLLTQVRAFWEQEELPPFSQAHDGRRTELRTEGTRFVFR